MIIKNIKKYIEVKKIRISFISNKSGIEESKLVNILNEKNIPTETELISISKALGKKVDYFDQENFKVKSFEEIIKEREEKDCIKLYEELLEIADRVEEIRVELYTNLKHKDQMIDDESFKNVNDQLFRFQSDLRQVVREDINIDNAKGIFCLD